VNNSIIAKILVCFIEEGGKPVKVFNNHRPRAYTKCEEERRRGSEENVKPKPSPRSEEKPKKIEEHL